MSTNYSQVVSRLRKSYLSGKTRSLDYREQQLKNLLRLYEENQELLCECLKHGLKKPRFEAYLFEAYFLVHDTKETLKHFRKWAKTEYLPKNLLLPTDTASIGREPYGVTLVIGTWNYPLQLTLAPLCGAIAAGNCVIVKPSELAPEAAKVMAQLIPRYLDPDCYQVIEGGPNEMEDLLKEKFDYIFYTGSTRVGKIIHQAAAQHLTPCTLELGGKCPTYVDDTVDYELAAKRLLWGKAMNMGQTCVSPDYVLCSKKTEDEIVKRMKGFLQEWYGNNPKESPDICRIVNDKHFQRLTNLLKNTKGQIVIGGETDPVERWISPTVVIGVQPDDILMQDEIFGPILPILRCDSTDAAINFINARERPLSLYVFSTNHATQNRMLKETSSGGACINDCIFQMTIDELPFGGVGGSGMGAYHGQATFDTFTHKKSVCRRTFQMWGETLGRFRYPKYTEGNIRMVKIIFDYHKWFYLTCGKEILFFILGFAAMAIIHFILETSSK